jgi:ribonucleoside-triphosphate reductase
VNEHLSFHLPEDFVNSYEDRQINWGFDIGAGNTLGEITFITKYSRKKDDGTKERWHEVCRRSIEGYYSILKDHCKQNRTPWNENKAQAAAHDAYERMFVFKWLPPGRGLWAMGTPMVHEDNDAAPLYNCAFLSTEFISSRSTYEAVFPFVRLMEMSMNGIGVGFDTVGAGKIELNEPLEDTWTFVVPDSREGWGEALGHLLESYFFKNRKTVLFDYSGVRPAGAPIKRFGGTASGPDPLAYTLEKIRELLGNRGGEKITSRDIIDINNLSGKAVVSGNTRRSAEIALGSLDDDDFIGIKNWGREENVERLKQKTGWGHLSNNTVIVRDGESPASIIDSISVNGEPGIYNLDLARKYGRLIDAPDPSRDADIRGLNPCAEITLEHNEVCNLTETFPFHHEDLNDYLRTLKHAYLYNKAVTLLPTPWQETNEVIARNRRIGTSMSGIVQYIETHDWSELRDLADAGYNEIQRRDEQYSKWLGVRLSIKSTTIKPSGSVSIPAGATPGVHWPVTSGGYIRRQRFSVMDPLIPVFIEAGYYVEPSVSDEQDVVVDFYVNGTEMRSERDVSVWEKVSLAVMMQRYWADNAVSATFTFSPDEKKEIGHVIAAYGDQLKTLSFLPMGDETAPGAYPQMPYESIDKDKFDKKFNAVKRLNTDMMYNGDLGDAAAENFCSNDTCEI